MPQLVGLQVDSVNLGPRAPCHSVLDLLAHDRPVANDGVGVELDDEVGGACTQQLWGRDGGGRLCEDMQKRRSLLKPLALELHNSATPTPNSQAHWLGYHLKGTWRYSPTPCFLFICGQPIPQPGDTVQVTARN